MAERRNHLSDVMDRLIHEAGVMGIELIRRDGECLMEHFRTDLDVSTYSRMSAALTATSESVLPEFRATPTNHVVVDAGQDRVVVVRANEQLLLAALTGADGASESIVRRLQSAAPGVLRLVPGS